MASIEQLTARSDIIKPMHWTFTERVRIMALLTMFDADTNVVADHRAPRRHGALQRTDRTPSSRLGVVSDLRCADLIAKKNRCRGSRQLVGNEGLRLLRLRKRRDTIPESWCNIRRNAGGDIGRTIGTGA